MLELQGHCCSEALLLPRALFLSSSELEEKSALKPKGLVVRFCMYIAGSYTRRLKIKINRSH